MATKQRRRKLPKVNGRKSVAGWVAFYKGMKPAQRRK